MVFDADGSLLDVHAAAARHAVRPGPQAAAISALWRQRQLAHSRIASAFRAARCGLRVLSLKRGRQPAEYGLDTLAAGRIACLAELPALRA